MVPERGHPRVSERIVRCARSSDCGGVCQGSQSCPSGADFREDLQTDHGCPCVTGCRAGYRGAQDFKP